MLMPYLSIEAVASQHRAIYEGSRPATSREQVIAPPER